MHSFLTTPSGDTYNTYRIGGAKAIPDGFLILGTGPDEILDYQEVPTDVALAWRDAMVTTLSSHRPNRPLRQIDWASIAVSVDPVWAETQGWLPAPAPEARGGSASATPTPPASSASAQPVRKPPAAAE